MASRVVRNTETPDQTRVIGSEASVGKTVASKPSGAPKRKSARRRLMDVEHTKELLSRIGCEKQIGV